MLSAVQRMWLIGGVEMGGHADPDMGDKGNWGSPS